MGPTNPRQPKPGIGEKNTKTQDQKNGVSYEKSGQNGLGNGFLLTIIVTVLPKKKHKRAF